MKDNSIVSILNISIPHDNYLGANPYYWPQLAISAYIPLLSIYRQDNFKKRKTVKYNQMFWKLRILITAGNC